MSTLSSVAAAGQSQDLEKIRESDLICFLSLFPEGGIKVACVCVCIRVVPPHQVRLTLEARFRLTRLRPLSFVHTSSTDMACGDSGGLARLQRQQGRGGRGKKELAGWLAGSEAVEGVKQSCGEMRGRIMRARMGLFLFSFFSEARKIC